MKTRYPTIQISYSMRDIQKYETSKTMTHTTTSLDALECTTSSNINKNTSQCVGGQNDIYMYIYK
jgi:hypothetical protein